MAAEVESVFRVPDGGVSGDVTLVDVTCPGFSGIKVSPVLGPLRSAVRSPWCFRGFAALTVLVGVVGQLLDVFQRSNLRALSESHVAFGLALLLTLSAWVLKFDAARDERDSIQTRSSGRALKFLVYLLLYVLALVKELLIVGSYLWRGGAITEMSDDFGIYLLFGVAAIALVPMAVALRSR